MAEQSLKEKTAKGLFWGGLSNGIQQLLNLVFGIFLARLLTPADYGMVGMLTIFSLIAGSIQESGFISALINKKDIKHEDYNAVFWFSTLTSICLYTILFFCAPLIARFFHQPELTALARYSFIGFVIASTGVVHNAYMYKHLMVKQRAIATIIALTISGTIGVTLAFHNFSYWGIITQNISYLLIITICSWYFSSWRPVFKINFNPLKGMIPFSCKMLATNIFNHLNNNIFSIILGKYYSEKEVGFYNQANKWNMMGYSFVSGMINNIAQPIFAKVADDNERQLRVFRKMIRFTAFISFPTMFGLSFVAPELIVITITSKWIESSNILQLLCINGAFIPIVGLCTYLIISKGKSDIYMWNTLIIGLLQLSVMFFIHPYGIYPMIITSISINISWLLIWHHFIKQEIQYRFVYLLLDILPFLSASIGSIIITHYFTFSITNIYILFITKIIIAATIYTLFMWSSGSKTFKESIQYLIKI